MTNRPGLPTIAASFLALASFSAAASPAFPYSTRTKPYTGWNSGVRGDDTIVGMSGATVALPFNIGASNLNPAGFAMLMGTVNAQISGTQISDGQIQAERAAKIQSNYYGLAVNPPPWGFAITSYSPTFESGIFHSPVTNRDVPAEVSVRELQFSASRMFFDNKFAFGASLDLAKANRNIGGENENVVGAGAKFGALFKGEQHLTFGLTYQPQKTLKGNPHPSTLVDMPGFSQPIIMPNIVGAGVGWTPNRFFQAGASVLFVDSTPETALLKDETVGVGRYPTLQPRVGGTYTFFQFAHYKGDVSLGTYYEVSRVEGQPNRLHGTASMDVNIQMFNTGIGIDTAQNYKNFMIGIGIDIVRTLRALQIVPKDPVPPYNGFFPHPDRISADGLSEGLSAGEPKSVPNQSLGDVKRIIEEAPGKIVDKLQGKPIRETPPSPRPTKSKSRARPKRRRTPAKPANPIETEAKPN